MDVDVDVLPRMHPLHKRGHCLLPLPTNITYGTVFGQHEIPNSTDISDELSVRYQIHDLPISTTG